MDRIRLALSRVTSDGRFIPVIDGLRFIAISAVVLYHLLNHVIGKSPVGFDPELRAHNALAGALNRGWFGVNLFFAISGFVICLPFVVHYLNGGHAVRLSKYYLRRLTRLEPPYILCITLCFILLVMVKGENFHDLLPHYFSSLAYSHNILYGERSTIAAVTWSLEIEIQFYILAPLIARVFALPKLTRRGILIAGICVACACQPLLRNGPLNLGQFIEYFLIGFLLADVYIADWDAKPSTTLLMDSLWVSSAILLYVLTGDPDKVWFDPLWCALTCAALFVGCYAAFRGRYISPLLSLPGITVIGGMCYTIYLYHEHILSLIGQVALRAHATHLLWVNYAIAFALMIPTTLVITSVLFLVFEKPFMQRDWPRRLKDGWHQLRARIAGLRGGDPDTTCE
jgi:peptidoglycan/LPS O-acetylase OafA/YrhL